MQLIQGTERKKIIESLGYYGITEIPLLLIETSPGRIRGYSGMLSKDEIAKLSKEVRIEVIGLYMFNNFDGDMRLSVDAIHLLKDQITKNILELNEKQAKEWMQGQDIALMNEDKEKLKNEPTGFKVIKYKDDFLGCAKLTHDRIVNYLPKNRRDKKQN